MVNSQILEIAPSSLQETNISMRALDVHLPMDNNIASLEVRSFVVKLALIIGLFANGQGALSLPQSTQTIALTKGHL